MKSWSGVLGDLLLWADGEKDLVGIVFFGELLLPPSEGCIPHDFAVRISKLYYPQYNPYIFPILSQDHPYKAVRTTKL